MPIRTSRSTAIAEIAYPYRARGHRVVSYLNKHAAEVWGGAPRLAVTTDGTAARTSCSGQTDYSLADPANANLPVASSIRAAENALNNRYDQQKLAAWEFDLPDIQTF